MSIRVLSGQNASSWNTLTPNYIEVRKSGGTLNRISFIDFQLSSITTTVTSAILNLYLSYNSSNVAGPETVEVYQVTSQSVIIDNDATWNLINPGGVASYTLGAVLATNSVSNISADNNKQYSFDITGLISSLAPGATKVTLCLKAATTAAPIGFWSVDYATEAYRPTLVVTTGGTTTSVSNANNNKFSISPALITNNVLSITNATSENYDVSIFNTNGQTMYAKEHNSGNMNINTSFLKSGVYLVRVSNVTENYTGKIIIP
jgi:hypothetical protein